MQQILHDEHSFAFLELSEAARERRLERSLVGEIEWFLIEFSAGFAFVGRQVPLEVDGEEFFIGMLFFHIPLNRYVVIELKLGKFRPQHAGQSNFYVNLVDDRLREERHGATIGLVLCASHNKTVARYALKGIDRPVGVARYAVGPARLQRAPDELRGRLPDAECISAGVQRNRRPASGGAHPLRAIAPLWLNTCARVGLRHWQACGR